MTLNQSALDSINQIASDAFGNTLHETDDSHMIISREGVISGTQLVVGGAQSLAQQRTQERGEQQTSDRVRVLSASYEVKPVYRRFVIDRLDVDGDQSGWVGSMIAGFAEEAQQLGGRAIWDALVANTLLGPDGVALFSNSHPFSSTGGTNDNLSGNALSAPEYATARAALRQLKAENGEVLNTPATHLFVSADLEGKAKEITGATRIITVDASGAIDPGASVLAAAGATNGYAGDSIVVSVPFMSSATWFLAGLSRPTVRPFAHGWLNRPEYIPATNLDEINRTGEIPFLVQGDLAVGPSRWELVYGKM